MLLNKDILIVDFETTGLNPHLLEPIEIGIVLISCEDLSEISRYHSYILSQHPETADSKALHVSRRTVESITTEGKSIAEVVMEIEKEIFEKNNLKHSQVYLSSWNSKFDIPILNELYKDAGFNIYEENKFDHHVIELWTLMLGYRILMGKSQNGLRGVLDSIRDFNIESQYMQDGVYDAKHNALEDCLLEAEILRKYFETFQL